MSRVVRAAWVVAFSLAPAGVAFGQAAVPPRAPAAAPAAPAVGGTAAAPRPPAPVTRPGPKKVVDPRTIQVLLDDGQAALAAGEHKAARDAFSDVVLLEPKNPVALASLGYTYLQLEDFPRARNSLDAAVTTAGATPLPKSLAVNGAAAMIRTRNPMRAAKFAKDYLVARPTEVDETCLNALGTALSLADDQARSLRFFQECATFYEAANARLEATRPGQKRWGSQWMTSSRADAKMSDYKSQLAEINRHSNAMAKARARFAAAEAAINRARAPAGFRKRQPIDTSGFERDKRDADAAYREAEPLYTAALAKLERPPFEPTIAAVTPEAVTTAVASVTPPSLTTTGGGAAGGLSSGTSGGTGTTGAGTTVRPPAVAVRPTTPSVTPPVRPTTTTPPATPEVAVAPPVRPVAPARKASVTVYAAAFAVAPDLLVTSAAAVEHAGRVTVQSADGLPMDVTVVERDAGSGLALLKTSGTRMNYLSLADAFPGGTIQGVSFPTVNVFDPIAEAIAGSAPAPKEEWTVRLSRHPRLGGGPLLAGGKVVGVQLATRDADPGQVPAATLAELKKFLGDRVAPGGLPDPATVTLQLTAVR